MCPEHVLVGHRDVLEAQPADPRAAQADGGQQFAAEPRRAGVQQHCLDAPRPGCSPAEDHTELSACTVADVALHPVEQPAAARRRVSVVSSSVAAEPLPGSVRAKNVWVGLDASRPKYRFRCCSSQRLDGPAGQRRPRAGQEHVGIAVGHLLGGDHLTEDGAAHLHQPRRELSHRPVLRRQHPLDGKAHLGLVQELGDDVRILVQPHSDRA